MTNDAATDYTVFRLPPSVVTRRDISQLVKEAERVDSELTTATVRAHVEKGVAATPVLSGQFSDFLAQNTIEFEHGNERTHIIQQLRILKDKAPIVHLVFAVVPDAESIQRLTEWLRQSVHQQIVVTTGVQPSLVAGVYIRTPNRVLDYSLRHALEGKHDILVKELETLRG